MVQYYHGIDLVDRNKFTRIFLSHARLLEEVFTEAEQQDCLARKDPWKHLAGRFAVKEACLKVLGLGLSGSGIEHAWREIELLAQSSGRWKLATRDWVARAEKKKGIGRWELSISYTKNYAVAAALLVVEPRPGYIH